MLTVRLESDPPHVKPDIWQRCPWSVIDPHIRSMLTLYWDAKEERVPMAEGTIDDWPVTLLALSRIIREEMKHATPKIQRDQGKAAAEAQRKAMEAKMLGPSGGRMNSRGGRRGR